MSYTHAYITPSSVGVFSNHTLYIMYHALRTYVLVRLLQKPQKPNACGTLLSFQLALGHKIRISLIRTPERVAPSTKQQSAGPPKKYHTISLVSCCICNNPFTPHPFSNRHDTATPIDTSPLPAFTTRLRPCQPFKTEIATRPLV
jgi:hypothetical protein